MAKKSDRTVVGRAPAKGRSVHEQSTAKLTDKKGPDEPTGRTIVDETAAKAQQRTRAAAASKDDEKTWTWRGRQNAAPRQQREPERAGLIALPGPPPPAPPRKP